MVSKYIPNQGGTHQRGDNWCEGETFEFTRVYNGNVIFNDRCTAAIQNNSIISYSLSRRSLKKIGNKIVRKPYFRFIDKSIKSEELQTTIIYRIKENNIIPAWQVQYEKYLFHYDTE